MKQITCKIIVTALILTCWANQAILAEQKVQTIYLVRHAEKVKAVKNPPLSDQGRARAMALVQRLETLPVTSIWSSDTLRTQSTVYPLAEARDLPIQIYSLKGGALSSSNELAEALLAGVGASHPVVVGHSNTVPLILKALGAPYVPSMDESEYGDLFIVIRPGTEQTQVLRYRFGDPPR